MKKENIPYNRQCIDDEDISSVVEALKSEYLTTGPEAQIFEQELCEYTGAKYAVVCSNGTAALHLAMHVLDVTENDTVLTTPITFAADANAARFLGATVTFADVCDSNANLDPEKTRALLEKNRNIKVVIPVHFAGQAVALEEFAKLADEYGVSIVEDACHALGASYRDSDDGVHRIGSCKYSVMTCFSFHPIKSITTGEGGAITTNDENLYRRLKRLRVHGTTREQNELKNHDLAFTEIDGEQRVNPWYYEMQELSPNYRISDFQCALGRSQLKKVEQFVQRRRYLAAQYYRAIEEVALPSIRILDTGDNDLHAFHLFVVRIPFSDLKGGRAALMYYLLDHGVQAHVHYIPIYSHPYYQSLLETPPDCPSAERYYDECLSLPLFVNMDDEDPCKVVEILAKGIEILHVENP